MEKIGYILVLLILIPFCAVIVLTPVVAPLFIALTGLWPLFASIKKWNKEEFHNKNEIVRLLIAIVLPLVAVVILILSPQEYFFTAIALTLVTWLVLQVADYALRRPEYLMGIWWIDRGVLASGLLIFLKIDLILAGRILVQYILPSSINPDTSWSIYYALVFGGYLVLAIIVCPLVFFVFGKHSIEGEIDVAEWCPMAITATYLSALVMFFINFFPMAWGLFLPSLSGNSSAYEGIYNITMVIVAFEMMLACMSAFVLRFFLRKQSSTECLAESAP